MSQDNLHNEKDSIATIQEALATRPSDADVSASFKKTMAAVTRCEDERILLTPQKQYEEPIISPFLMQLHTKLSLAAGTLVVVLLVGYMTYSRSNPYQDLERAAIDTQEEYDLSVPEDGFSDLTEDFVDSPEATSAAEVTTSDSQQATTPAPTTPTPLPTTTSVDVTAELASFDTLFSSDDIDDSSLESWMTDTSASDGLTESYDI
jgi:hypothetical protein